MATYSFFGYDDDQVVFPGGSPSNGETITFTAPADHELVFTDGDTSLQDGTDDRDDEDGDQLVTVYDEFGAVETSGQVQPRERVVLDDGTNTHVMHRVFIASSNSYYYIFEDPPPALNTTYTVTSVTTPNSTPYSNFSTAGVTCFTRGTRLATPRGWRAVERLKPGARVFTLDNGPQRVMWVGQRHVSGDEMRACPHLQPFVVRAGALGNGRPGRDVLLSRQHRVLLAGPRVELHLGTSEVLVPVHALTDLAGIERVRPAFGVDYFHVATRRHELVLAEGMPTETLLVTAYSESLAGSEDAHSANADADEVFPGLSQLGLNMDVPARMILGARRGRELARLLTTDRPGLRAAV